MSGEKAKKTKPLPTHIHYSVLLTYFVTVIILAGGLSVYFNIVPVNDEMTRDVSMGLMALFAPIAGFIFGWWGKWAWTKRNGTDEQFMRIKATFWATMGFTAAFVIGLLLILILLLMLEQDALLPQSAPDPIIFMISGTILLIATAIGWNTRQRILKNFGY